MVFIVFEVGKGAQPLKMAVVLVCRALNTKYNKKVLRYLALCPSFIQMTQAIDP